MCYCGAVRLLSLAFYDLDHCAWLEVAFVQRLCHKCKRPLETLLGIEEVPNDAVDWEQ